MFPILTSHVAFRYFVQVFLFMMSFGICSFYSILIAKILKKIFQLEINDEYIIGFILLPLILMSWVPDLKYLARISMVANVCMIIALVITSVELVKGDANKSVISFSDEALNYAHFASICFFGISSICK